MSKTRGGETNEFNKPEYSVSINVYRGKGQYLAGVEMSVDLNDDLVIFVRCLLPGDHDLGCRQILQLIDLQTPILMLGKPGKHADPNMPSFGEMCVDSWRVQFAYSLASLANDPSCCRRGHLDVGLQFHLFLWSKEILFLQFAVDSALSLEEFNNVKRRLGQ